MEIQKKKAEKEKTKGTKQIAKENWETLCFYRNMILGANGLYFCVMTLLSKFMWYTLTENNLSHPLFLCMA